MTCPEAPLLPRQMEALMLDGEAEVEAEALYPASAERAAQVGCPWQLHLGLLRSCMRNGMHRI